MCFSSLPGPAHDTGWTSTNRRPPTRSRCSKTQASLRARRFSLASARVDFGKTVTTACSLPWASSESAKYVTSMCAPGNALRRRATATVSALVADLMDRYISNGSTWIDDPGALYAVLLVMGDRETGTGKATAGFHHRWGAGRLRARTLDPSGMDYPWYFWHYSVCIDHGEYYYVNLDDGSPLPNDVNVLKAAAYWMDKRHESTGEVANVDLMLQKRNSVSLIWETMANDADADDNKAFVFKHFASGVPTHEPLRLRVRGVDVVGHDFGCGNDSIMVHLAVFAEDSDREAPTGYNSTTGEGIAPEEI
jgi:hypothetical protein